MFLSVRTCFGPIAVGLPLAFGALTAAGHAGEPSGTGAASTQIDAATEEAATPWTSLAPNDAPEDFHFVIVTDRTGGERPGVFPAAMPKVNLLEPAFVVSVGDLIEGYTEDQAQLDREWDEFAGFVNALETPFFHVAGNHDMSNAVMAETWRARFGPSYYHFVYKDVLFVALNSELFGMVSDPASPVPGPWTQAEQLAWLEGVLADHPQPRWTIILVHQPLWDYREGVRGDWPRVEAMLGERDYTVFAGHFHRYVKHVRNNRKYFTLGTTGGGSSLRGPLFGEFDHVAWVTMTADGPRIANLLLDGITDENVVTAKSREVVEALAGGVTSTAQLFDGDAFESGSVTFEIRNAGAAPLAVTPTVAAGPTLRHVGDIAPLTLAPGEMAEVAVELAASVEPLPWASVVAGRVTWSLNTRLGERPIVFDMHSALLPAGRMMLPAGAAPTLDGDLGDWPTLPFVVDRQGDVLAPSTAPEDISYRFALRESGGDIYFAAQVVDDSVPTLPWDTARYQDHVLLSVDARPAPERSRNLPLYAAIEAGDLARLALDYMTPGDQVAEDPSIGFLDASRAAVEWRTRRTATGYDVEAKVSGAFLDAQHGSPWHTARIAVQATDVDADEPGLTALHWQPYRLGAAPAAGSGTFVRAGAGAEGD